MLVTNLKSLLLDFCSLDNPSRSLLVDGKWGCGKTYNINAFLRENKTQNAIYISLFGLNSKEEIVLHLFEYLDSSLISLIGGKYSLRSLSDKNSYNGTLIVFDDVERTGTLSFIDVCGTVDSLKKLGFKVVCVCDLINIKDNANNLYFEKTFDYIVNVEADVTAFSQIANVNVDFEKSLLQSVNGNWRIIQRSDYIYHEIIKHVEQEKGLDNFFSASGLDNNSLFRCVVLAVTCFFSTNNSVPSFKKDEGFIRLSYEENSDSFGSLIANEFHNLFYIKKENKSYMEIVKDIIYVLNTFDYQSFIEKQIPTSDPLSIVSEYPFDKEIFYLDDEGHKEYKKAFFDNLKRFDFMDKQQNRLLANVIIYYLDEMSDQEENSLISHIMQTVPVDDSFLFLDNLFPMGYGHNERIENFRIKLAELFATKKQEKDNLFIDNLLNSNNYSKLTDYLYENRYSLKENKNRLLEAISQKGFCLPDLSKEINNSMWSYCHEVTRFVANTDYQEIFIEALKNQCRHSNSIELRKKCDALVRYNLNEKVNFFEIK